jgi:hypothetical protein
MKRLAFSLLFAAAATIAAPASATVLTFDDVGVDGSVPAHYGGLDWSASDWFVFGGPEDPYTPHSGDFRAVSGFDDPDAATIISFARPSLFQGAWFSGLDGATVTFMLYRAGALIATSATLDPSDVPQFLSSGFTGLVDQVVIASPGQGSFAMDDFTFSAVPEPSIALLMLAGAAGIGVVRRRRATTTRD